ncbi:MAG: glycosyltransferase family 2 protein [Myxococcota bacterium]
MSRRVLTIIVNYKTPDLTIKAYRSALAQLDEGDIMVVDNDSADGSFQQIAEAITNDGVGDRVQVVASDFNGGFGYGNNFAIRKGLAADTPYDYFYLLNSDAFPEDGAISTLVDFLERRPEAGIVGSYIHGVDGTPHDTAFRFPTAAGELESTLRLGVISRLLKQYVVSMGFPEDVTQVDWLAGCSMMIRRRVLEEIGLFDETYFLYFEETDLCMRARRQGWLTYYVPQSRVAHVGSASTGIQNLQRRTPRYWFDSREHYFRKNYGDSYLWTANAAWIVGQAVWSVRRRIQGKPKADAPKIMEDFVRHMVRR